MTDQLKEYTVDLAQSPADWKIPETRILATFGPEGWEQLRQIIREEIEASRSKERREP